MSKLHTRRVQLPVSGVFVWGLFLTRKSPRPFAMSSNLTKILKTAKRRHVLSKKYAQ